VSGANSADRAHPPGAGRALHDQRCRPGACIFIWRQQPDRCDALPAVPRWH
jgi:hypothetical protein